MLGGGQGQGFLRERLSHSVQEPTALGAEIQSLGLESLPSTAFGAGSAGFINAYPFRIRVPTLITKLWWLNGTTSNGNLDCGIYDLDYNLLVSAGTTGQGTISSQQAVDVTDTWLSRGTYYCALIGSSTTGTVLAMTAGAGYWQTFGCWEQAGVTLPLSTGASPATPVTYSRAFMPFFGFQSGRAFGP